MAEDHDHKDGELCRDCGTMQVHRRLLDTDRNYARRLAKIEDHAFRVMSSGVTLRPGCTRIPVVVHVVYRTAAENISQAQIDTQIDVINEDFRKKNADISTIPAPFAPLAADARIEFVLATEDPDGNPTDGVTRTQTTKTSFNSNDDIKFDSRGGKDAWDTSEYLNIWVGNLGGGLLGYAQFPGGPSDTDGVVVTHRGFGTTGTAQAPFDKGRTATHEIGHWLNLRHIWGDDGSGCSGSDFVADTPNQGGPNTGKPAFPKVSCSNGPNGDMFMNYMDYVDDDTMVMFTEGQVARMQACLDGPRSSIGEAIPCITKSLPKDLGKDGPKEFPKEWPKEGGKEGPKEFPKEWPKEGGKEGPKEFPKEFPKDGGKERPKEFPKELKKEWPKEGPKEFPKDPGKHIPKDGPFDPGPKSIRDPGPKTIKDPGPKSIIGDDPKSIIGDGGPKGIKDPGPKYTPKESPFDPGPKHFKDPGPKSIIGDGPKLRDPGPKTIYEGPQQPGGPIGYPVNELPQINQPFVLSTGTNPYAPAQPTYTGYDYDERAAMARHYEMMLATYDDLYQRGLLDEQGMMAYQQLYDAYMQLA